MHFLRQLQHFVPLKNGFYNLFAITNKRHLIDPDSYTAVPREVADLYR